MTVEPDEPGVLEVEFDVQTFTPGARWQVTLHHNGDPVLDEVLTPRDDDGDLWVTRYVPDLPGPDRFEGRATALDAEGTCEGTVTWDP